MWIDKRLVLLLCTGVIILSAIILSAPAHAGQNWCSDWKEGFAIGYCWTREECTYIPPQYCPYPEDDQQDGYVVGLRQGLEAGKVTL